MLIDMCMRIIAVHLIDSGRHSNLEYLIVFLLNLFANFSLLDMHSPQYSQLKWCFELLHLASLRIATPIFGTRGTGSTSSSCYSRLQYLVIIHSFLDDCHPFRLSLDPNQSVLFSHLRYIALLPSLGNYSFIRALRAFRTLRSLKAFPGVRAMLAAIFSSLPGLKDVFIFLIFCVAVFGIIGIEFFAGTLYLTAIISF